MCGKQHLSMEVGGGREKNGQGRWRQLVLTTSRQRRRGCGESMMALEPWFSPTLLLWLTYQRLYLGKVSLVTIGI